MIDTSDPSRLCRIIEAAEADRDRILEMAEERERSALGILGEAVGSQPSPENLGFALYRALLPSMVTSSPVFNIRSNGSHQEQKIASGIAAACTQMAQKQRMHQALEPCAWDFVFKVYCAAFVEKPLAKMSDLTKEERAAMKGRMHEPFDDGGEADDVKAPRATETPRVQIPARWPRVKHLRARECGFDPEGGSIAEAQFTWHDVRESRASLRRRAEQNSSDWYVDAVEALDTHGSADRDEVKYRVVYVPGGTIEGQDPEPNQPGIILTVGRQTASQDGTTTALGVELRRPFYWEGHPGGPHIFEGQYTTGTSESYYTTILLANHDALAMLDAVSHSVSQKIREHEVKYGYDAAYQAEIEELQKAGDGDFVALPGLRDGRILERIETGQVTPAEVAELREVQMNARRAIGVDEAQQGVADPDATATAVSVAANATRSTVRYLIGRWERFVSECCERVAYEAAHDDRVVVRLSEEGRAQVWETQLKPLLQPGKIKKKSSLDLLVGFFKENIMPIQGGDFGKDGEFDWDSLDVSVKVGSMDGTLGDQAIARESAWNQQLAFLGQAAMSQPHMDWDTRIARTARAFGMDEGDKIMDKQVLQSVLRVQLAQGPQGQAGLEGQMTTIEAQGATLRESSGGARSPAGVDPGQFQQA